MPEPDLYQLSSQLQQLKSDFETHLALEEVRCTNDEKWRNETGKKVDQMYKIMTEGQQSWKTILFAASMLVAGFSFLGWVVSTVFQFKDIIMKVIK